MNSDPSPTQPAFEPHEHAGEGSHAEENKHRIKLEEAVTRIQLIEDLPLVQNLLRDLLEETGQYKICAMSETEQSAIADFRRHEPAAVIVDLNLKQGSGLGFLQQVRKMHLKFRPVLIVVTNYAIPALKTACMKAGADYFLDKSRDLSRLRLVIDESLAGKGNAH